MTTGFLTDSGIRVWSQTVNDETFDVAPHGRLAALPNHRWKAGLKPPVSSIALRM